MPPFQLHRAISSASSEVGTCHATIASRSEGGRRWFHLHWQNSKQSQSTPRREVSPQESPSPVPKTNSFDALNDDPTSLTCPTPASQHRATSSNTSCPMQTPACPAPHPAVIVCLPAYLNDQRATDTPPETKNSTTQPYASPQSTTPYLTTPAIHTVITSSDRSHHRPVTQIPPPDQGP